MADISDVETALVNLISATVYPNGTGGSSAIGAPCRVYRGWPDARALDADIRIGVVHITVFSEKGGRRTTRYPHVSNPYVITPPTITVSTAAPTVTFAGPAGVACLAGLRTNVGAWAVAVTAAMTPTDIATALAAAVTAAPPPGGITATASGAGVTVSPSTGLLGRVVAVGTTLTEVRRQVQPIRVSFWAPSAAVRDTAASAVDATLGGVDWLTLADGTGGRLLYRADFVDDVPSKDLLWRRDVCYDVEYPTTLVQNVAAALWVGGVLDANGELITLGDIFPAGGTYIYGDGNGNIWTDAVGNLIGQQPS